MRPTNADQLRITMVSSVPSNEAPQTLIQGLLVERTGHRTL